MPEEELVVEIDAPANARLEGGRPRFYRITPLGRRACAREAERLAAFVDVARRKKIPQSLTCAAIVRIPSIALCFGYCPASSARCDGDDMVAAFVASSRSRARQIRGVAGALYAWLRALADV